MRPPFSLSLYAEGLSSLIRKYEVIQWIHGVRICRKAPVISHMLFTNDSYVYCKATPNEGLKVLELLNIYKAASGQKVNTAKSSIFFSSNIIQYNRDDVCSTLSIMEEDARRKYLGLPNILGRNKLVILGFLKEKVSNRVRSWID